MQLIFEKEQKQDEAVPYCQPAMYQKYSFQRNYSGSRRLSARIVGNRNQPSLYGAGQTGARCK